MDGFWSLFCATGEPVFYLMYRRPRDGAAKKDGAAV